MARIDEYIENRKNNFNFLLEKNIEPYPYTFNKTHSSKNIHEKYVNLKNEENSNDFVSVAGRLLVIRNLGKIIFLDLHDQDGKIQCVIKCEENNKETIEVINKLDVGDIVGVTGKVFRTKRGEISIDIDNLVFLSKCFLPLPDKWHGLEDAEIIYRKRYLDLIINEESRKKFIVRSQIISIIRNILLEKGFIEVETPLLQTLYGGANARPFITEAHVWKKKLYLSISPELYLKRLLVGGFEKVFTICKNFRNEGIDKSHNPEFTMMECYETYKDYNSAMNLIEEIYETIALKLYGTTKINYQGTELDFKKPWKRLTMKDALKELANIDINALSDKQIKELLEKENLYLEEYKRGLAIAELFEHFCEPMLIQPIHIIDQPKETTPLCKLKRDDKTLIERDEPFCCSMELGNIYSELNDSKLQRKLMEEQKNQGRAKGENHPIDDDFIEALEYGMPPAYGIGIGIDRIVMLFTNAQNIRDVILFPILKDEEKKN